MKKSQQKIKFDNAYINNRLAPNEILNEKRLDFTDVVIESGKIINFDFLLCFNVSYSTVYNLDFDGFGSIKSEVNNTKLSESVIKKTTLYRLNVYNLTANNIKFINCRILDVNIVNSIFSNITFENCDFNQVNFRSCDLNKVEFIDSVKDSHENITFANSYLNQVYIP